MKSSTTDKPWGSFTQFTHNELSTVKTIFVKAGEQLSLQTHAKREEFWKVISGTPTLTIGEEHIEAQPGDEFTIPAGLQHRIATTQENALILEISTGDFDENDIIRLEDKYGRS
ncbi:MAG: phosphomannose isomerase type II C-terminal cupin domain [Patescibacteria group bacterium]